MSTRSTYDAERTELLAAIAVGIGPRAFIEHNSVKVNVPGTSVMVLRVEVHVSAGFRSRKTGVYAEAGYAHRTAARARHWTWEPHKPLDVDLVPKVVAGVVKMLAAIDAAEAASTARRLQEQSRADALGDALLAEGVSVGNGIHVSRTLASFRVEVSVRADDAAAAARIVRKFRNILDEEKEGSE